MTPLLDGRPLFAGLVLRIGRTGIRVRLIFLVVLTAAPFLAIIVSNGLAERSQLLGETLARNAGVARLLAAQQDDLLAQARAVLGFLKSIPTLAADAPACHTFVQQVVRTNPQFDTLGITDGGGEVICHSVLERHQPFADPAFFKRVTAEGAPSFLLSGFRRSYITSQPVMLLAMPIAGRAGQGMIFAALKLNWFEQSPASLADIPHLRIAVVDVRDGTILARVPDTTHFAGKRFPASATLRQFQASPHGGSMIGQSFDGLSWLVTGFAPLAPGGPPGAMVIFNTPLDDVVAEISHRLLANLAVLAVAIIGAGLADWAMLKFSLLRPLQAIQDVAARLGAGDLTTRVPTPGRHGRELRELAKTLNITAGRLQRTAIGARLALAKLAQQEAEYRQLADNTSDTIFRLDLNLVASYVSPACQRMLGYRPEELAGRSVSDIIHPDDVDRVEPILQMLLAETEWASIGYRLLHQDGRYIRADVHFRAVGTTVGGAPIGIVATARDVTARHDAAEALAASEARYRLLADYSTDLILQADNEFRRMYVSPSCRTLLGYDPEEFRMMPLTEVIHPQDLDGIRAAYRNMKAFNRTEVVRYRYRRKDGEYLWVEGIGGPMPDGHAFVITVRDLTHRLAVEQELETANRRLEVLASQDGLTGLANRRRFDETLTLEFRRAERGMMPLSLIMIDVDFFKRYNDTYGHQAGDACLQDVALALRQAVQRTADLAARYGGEEMVVLLPDTEAPGALMLAEQLRRAVRGLAREHSASPAGLVTVSLGVATIFPGFAHNDPAILVASADAALYRAKAAGRDCVMEGVTERPELADPAGTAV